MRRSALLLVAALVTGLTVTPSPAAAAPAPEVGDAVTFSTDQGALPALDATIGPDGAWWSVREDGRVVRIGEDDEVDVFETPLLPGGDAHIVSASDGTLRIFASSTSTYVRLTVDGVATAHPDPVTETIYAAAPHPDGTTWVLTQHEIVRVALDGTVAGTIALPGDASVAFTITPTGDALTVRDVDELVRVKPNGDVELIAHLDLGAATHIFLRPDGTTLVVGYYGRFTVVEPDGSTTPVEIDEEGQPNLLDAALDGAGNVWLAGFDGLLRIEPDLSVTAFPTPDISLRGDVSTGPDGRVWVSEDGILRRIAAHGTVEVRHLGVDGPFDGTVGPDGAAWTFGLLDGNVARVDPDGTVHAVAQLGRNQAYFGMTTGPDGALWVAGGNLHRVTTGGEVTTFDLPGIADAGDVAVGPDGNLWVSDLEGAVARVTLDGTPTVFALPEGFEPFHVLPGTGDTLWLSDRDSGTLVEVTTHGEVTVVPVPGMSEIRSVSVGPDGDLWLVGNPATTVVRRAADGTITTYPLGTFAARAGTIGPDGHLWLARATGAPGAVARLTAAGDLTTFPAPGASRAMQVFATPDGWVWVPGGDNTITRVAVGVVDVALDVTEDAVVAGDEVDASITVTNTGPTALTDVDLTSDALPACAAEVPDLAPGEEHTSTCTDALEASDPVVTVDTAETQPKAASDVVAVSPRPRCLGQEVTVDLNRGDEPTAGPDVVLGTPEADTIATLGGADLVCAGQGDDEVLGGGADDRLMGGPGRDALDGGIGDDTLRGAEHPDQLTGGPGIDLVDGADGVDTLHGGAQADRLVGGSNRDTCDGGGGIDRAVSCEKLSGVP